MKTAATKTSSHTALLLCHDSCIQRFNSRYSEKARGIFPQFTSHLVGLFYSLVTYVYSMPNLKDMAFFPTFPLLTATIFISPQYFISNSNLTSYLHCIRYYLKMTFLFELQDEYIYTHTYIHT